MKGKRIGSDPLEISNILNVQPTYQTRPPPLLANNPLPGNYSGFAHETTMESMIKMIATKMSMRSLMIDAGYFCLCVTPIMMGACGISRLPLLNNSILTGVRKFPLISKISIRQWDRSTQRMSKTPLIKMVSLFFLFSS